MSTFPPEATPQGDRLAGRYRLLDSLGTGGSSSVFRAWDEVEEAFRAVKVLDGAIAHNPRIRQRLLQEAELMSRLAHPNVVVVYEAGADDARLFLVMELLTGGSVMERIAEDGPLPPRMATTVMGGVLSALQCAHDHGVVHRDVKPHNILLDGKGTPKVTDFGIARWDDAAMTRTGTVLGTLAFMPPEQKLSARKVDLRSDVYSTGATLYTMLTGRFPHDLYAAELDESIARELYKGIPEPLSEVIRRATSFRLEERFASASAMQAALAAAVWELPEDPPGPPLVSPFRIGRARSQASLGPTLMGVTESAESTDLAKASPPAPPPLASSSGAPPLAMFSSEQQRPAVGLVLAVLVGVGIVATLTWLRRDQGQAENPPVPVEFRLNELPKDKDPAPDTGVENVGAPRSRKPKQAAEEAELPPEPAPTDASNMVEVGRWRVEHYARRRQKTDVIAKLPADVDVPGPNGQRIRPALVLRCLGRSRPLLQTGLQGLTLPEVRVSLDGAAEELIEVTPLGELVFAARSTMKILSASTLTVHLGDAGDTTFTLEHGQEILAELEQCR